MYTTTELFPASLEMNFHPFGVPFVMTVPPEFTGSTANVLLFAPVSVGFMPHPRALSVLAVHCTAVPPPVMLTVALLT